MRRVVARSRAPSAEEVGASTGAGAVDVRDGWRRLHETHALVLDDGGREIRMANPFSAVATPFRVAAAGRSWFANCAWDAFGICTALGTDGRIESVCPDCQEPIECDVRDRRPGDTSLLFHCLVQATDWWDDIVFT